MDRVELANAPNAAPRPTAKIIAPSRASTLVARVSGLEAVDQRFFFPKEMLQGQQNIEVFEPIYEKFQSYIQNNHIINPKEEK